MSALLEVSSLATGYGDIRVVWDVSFEVRPGEVTALLGRNGAGKTTTLRAVAGLNKATAGTVTFRGARIDGESVNQRVRRGIGFVQEGKRVFHKRTVEENLLLGGYSRGLSRRKLTAAAGEVYELFPILRERRKAVAGALSGGQQQMLAIGQALMAKPGLLMLDEPSAGLAPAIVTEVMSTVERLKATGIGILLVEQAVEAAVSVADRVCVLDVGRVVLQQSGAPDVEVIKRAYFGVAQ